MNSLKGKVVLITGASSGIGAATAIKFAAEGAIVGLAARRTEKLVQLKKDIEEHGGQAIVLETDVVSESDAHRAVNELIMKFGTIDILFNNAGVMPISDIDQLKTSEWNSMIDINIKGVLNMTAAVLPHMIQKKSGHIFNTSSIAGRKVFGPGYTVYSATKYAVTAFSEGLRMEIGNKHNIRVTCIQPGAVATELPEQTTDPLKREELDNYRSLIKFLDPSDIAESLIYAAKAPSNVNVAEIFLLPTEQS